MNREEFLAERRTGIGGSDIAAICGMDPDRSAHRVWLEKMGRAPEVKESGPILRGRAMEPLIVQMWAEETGRQILTTDVKKNTWRHPEKNHFIAHVDATAVDFEHGEKWPSVGYAEGKSLGLSTFAKTKREGLAAKYYLQGQWYFGVLPANVATFGGYAVHNAELWQLLHFDIPRDPEIIGQIQQQAEKFWVDHVLKEVPPPLETEPAIEAVPELEAAERKLIVKREDPEWLEAVASFWEARGIKKEAEAYEEQTRATLKALAGNQQIIEGGGYRVYYKPQAAGAVFDAALYAAQRPLDRMKVAAAVNDVIGKALDPDVPDLTERLEVLSHNLTTALKECDLPLDMVQKPKKAARPLTAYLTGGKE